MERGLEGDAPAMPRRARGCVKSEALFHTAGRQGHIRIKDVALCLPGSIYLFRHKHPLAVVEMGAVCSRDHVGPRAIADIVAALGASDYDLDLGESPIFAGLELGQNGFAA